MAGTDLIGRFARHPVASSLLMLSMMASGLWALSGLNAQFFPSFDISTITVRVEWRGAAAEDVEEGLTTPLEDELRDVDNLKRITSTSTEALSTISLEFEEGTDMSAARADVEERISRVRDLPAEAEDPRVTRIISYSPIARVLISGDVPRETLRAIARRGEAELLGRGVAKVTVNGVPEAEITIGVSSERLRELGVSLDQLAGRVSAQSRNIPAGDVGDADVARQLRSLDEREDAVGFSRLPVPADASGNVADLGAVAEVVRRPRDGSVLLWNEGLPAVELALQRGQEEDALAAARILEQWLADTRSTLPPGVELVVYEQRWTFIKERIQLLLKNGAGGLVLVVAILFLFLNGRVAFWVTAGIPASFLAALAVLYLVGGSINMVSLFGMIMSLGIIVDDAIVVGEDALAHHEMGESALQAAEGGARRMLAPVMSSSLTTIAAFLPLMAVSGIIGTILFDIPLVVVCVIVASLVEGFLVLPGHLRGSFQRIRRGEQTRLRRRLDTAFNRFRDGPFRRLVTLAVAYRATTLALAVAALVATLGLVAGGRLAFTFFPNVEGNIVFGNVSFAAGTPPERVEAYLRRMEQAVADAEASFGRDLVVAAVTRRGTTFSGDPRELLRGDRFGSVVVELVSPDVRGVRNAEFVRAWRERVPAVPGLEELVFREPRQGPPGSPIDVELTGAPVETLKRAAEEVKGALKRYPGVSAISDDLPYGRQQLIYRLTPEARDLGMTVEEVGRQLRAAYAGELVQVFQDGRDEVEVRVRLPERERSRLDSLGDLTLRLPGGGFAPLSTLVELDSRRGFEALRHADGRLAVRVTAEVDTELNNANRILAELDQGVLADLRNRYNIDSAFEGRAREQRETLGDMTRGAAFALAMIYVILAWVFGSYGWPLVVMAIMPFGLIGALLGHYVMGLDVTLLSLFGIFGLMGIIVNDSIILVTFYKQLRERGMPVDQALVEAARLRLRAVLLTSLTTIGGLLPLLFETSLQAQFLIPMAVSISFGLAGATALVLFVVPALLSVHESVAGHRVAEAEGWPADDPLHHRRAEEGAHD